MYFLKVKDSITPKYLIINYFKMIFIEVWYHGNMCSPEGHDSVFILYTGPLLKTISDKPGISLEHATFHAPKPVRVIF